MKKISMLCFGALAIVLAGCSKNNAEPQAPAIPMENAWMFDETLPVPIQFGLSKGVDIQNTKTMIETWDDLDHYLGIFALNMDGAEGLKKGSYDVFLDNEPADCVYDENRGKDMIKFNENKYYPYSSDRNLSFFGYYPYFYGNAPEYYADSIRINIPASEWGKHDIMCASSYADTMFVKKDFELGWVPAARDEATAYYNGYNASYMRYLNKFGLYEERLPNLLFKHKTTCFTFDAYLTDVPTDKVTDFDQVPIIQSIEITGIPIYESAYLLLAKKDVEDKSNWTGDLRVVGEGSSTLKLGGKNARDLNATPGADLKYVLPDNQFFLQPMSTSEKLTIKITLENPYNGKREVFSADFPEIPAGILEFKEGSYYPFVITINYFTGIEITADIDPWLLGWANGTENDKIGEDAPSGKL